MASSPTVDFDLLFLKTSPLQSPNTLWLALPAALRFLLQLIATLILSAFAVKFLATEYASAPGKSGAAQSANPTTATADGGADAALRASTPASAADSVAVAISPAENEVKAQTAATLPSTDSPASHASAKLVQWPALVVAALCVAAGVLLCVFVDRFRIFPILAKVRSSGADSIIAIVLFVLLAATFTISHEPKDAAVFVSTRQTDEWKGAAMCVCPVLQVRTLAPVILSSIFSAGLCFCSIITGTGSKCVRSLLRRRHGYHCVHANSASPPIHIFRDRSTTLCAVL
jgi:hypothetical protein